VANPGQPQPRAATVAYGPRPPSQAGAPRKRVILAGPPPLSLVAVRVDAAGLLIAVGLAVGGLFPVSTVGAPADSHSLAEIVQHVMGAGVWLVGAILLLTGRPAAIRVGNAMAAGATIVTTGITITQASQLIGTSVSLGAGFYLEVAANLVAVIAAIVGLVVLRRSTAVSGFGGLRPRRLIPALIAGAAIVAGFIPAWQHVHIASVSPHQSANPAVAGQFDTRWEVIAGRVVILIGVVAVPVIASQWRRVRSGGALIIGATVAFSALILTTVVAAWRPFAQFSKSLLALIKKEKVTESVHFLGWFYVLIAGVVLLTLVGIAALLARRSDPELKVARRR
jgi:hypothetical protein